MTVEFYDLAQRLYAAKAGHPITRIASALFTLDPEAIVVEATQDKNGTVRAHVGTALIGEITATGADVLRALAGAGAQFGTDRRQLVMPDAASLTALAGLAREHRFDRDAAITEAAAVTGWWIDRAGYPGTGAVINLLDQSRQRFVTGAPPTAERATAHWRTAFGAATATQTAANLLWAKAVATGVPMTDLAPVHEDDNYTWTRAAQRFERGDDWAAPDRAAAAAMGLRRRCDTADLWESALLSDRLWRHRAVHTGHVTGGPVVAETRGSFTVRGERLDVRLREGSSVTGWQGGLDRYDHALPFIAEIAESAAHEGSLLLTLTGVRAEGRPHIGEWVSLMAAPPDARTVGSGRSAYANLQFHPNAWISSGKAPGERRREVPLDILYAAAETEDN